MSTDKNDLELTDFFETKKTGPGRLGRGAGSGAMLVLHGVMICVLLYSAAHGISASLGFAGNSMWQRAAQVAGIVMIEAVMLSLHVAYHNGRIRGSMQPWVALLTYLVGFGLSAMGILADSQINAEMAVDGWVSTYLHWGLPLAPLLMAVGAAAVHILDPEKVRMREQADAREDLEDVKFQAEMANEQAQLDVAKAAANMRLNAAMETMRQVYDVYRSDEVQEAIRRQALNTIPRILRAAGIDVTGLRQTLLPPSSDYDGYDTFSLDDGAVDDVDMDITVQNAADGPAVNPDIRPTTPPTPGPDELDF